jgi:hypothetical protein
MLVEMIETFLTARAAAKETKAQLGAHNAGQCPRKNWYLLHGYTPEPFQARTISVFDLGNRVEDSILEALVEAAAGAVRRSTEDDKRFVEELGGRVVPDAFLTNGDETVIVEVKSMSDFAFDRLERGEIDQSYLDQVEVYLRAFAATKGILLGYRKQTSHIAEKLIYRDDIRWARIKANVRLAQADVCPERPYQLREDCSECGGSGKTPGKGLPHKACGGTGRLPGGPAIPSFPCGYCGFKETCWGKLTTSVDSRGRPVWRTAERGIS